MIHHLVFPKDFLNECHRILKPGGNLIIQEIHSSLMMRAILRLMRHEGFDETINVFDHDKPCNLVNDPWSANCSVPKVLFSSHMNFERVFPDWSVIHDKKVEFFQFLNSGGVIAKTFYIPLSPKILLFQDNVDQLLCRLAPNLFALQRQIILEKRTAQKWMFICLLSSITKLGK